MDFPRYPLYLENEIPLPVSENMFSKGGETPDLTPVLLKVALPHVQFETIHPFLDGNGRLLPLLITLLMCEEKLLREPMLSASAFTSRRTVSIPTSCWTTCA